MKSVRLEFGGGMEFLFGNRRRIEANLPAEVASIRELLPWMREQLLAKDGDPALFMSGDTIRPGILILINDVDWELEGEEAYQLQEHDAITFISTLHGG